MVLEQLIRAGFSPDNGAFWLALAAIIALIFLAFHARKLSRRGAHWRNELEKTRVALAGAEARAAEAAELKEDLRAVAAEKASLEAEAAGFRARLAERERALDELKQRMDAEFRAAASQMLDHAHKAFLERANETFSRHQQAATADAVERRKAIDDLVKPMSDTLQRYEQGLKELRDEQQKSRGELVGRITDLARSANDVRMEAQKLSTALRAGAKTRGRWGEEQLRNVVETAGMAAYVDFVEQSSHNDGDKRMQPDMVVNLPGGRKIAVDSKVSINAYLDAVESENDEDRARHFVKHADHLWAHVKALSAKGYAAGIKDSLDIVVMFVPGENYFGAAADARPELIQDAFDKGILIATPMTLVAMLKAVSLNWRQEKATENARAVASMAKDLHDSLRVMARHIADLGKSLGHSVDKFNATVGSFERRVLPRARKFAEYELPGIDAEIEDLQMIETAPAATRDERDLLSAPLGEGGANEPH